MNEPSVHSSMNAENPLAKYVADKLNYHTITDCIWVGHDWSFIIKTAAYDRTKISNYSTIYFDRLLADEVEYCHFNEHHVRQNRIILFLADPSFISTLIGLISKDFKITKNHAQTHNT